MVLGDLQRPIHAQAGTKRSHWHLADVIAGQLQGTLAAQPRLGIL